MGTSRRRSSVFPRIKPPQPPKPPKAPSGPKPPPGLKRPKGLKGLKGLKDLPDLPGLPGPRSSASAGPADPNTLELIERALAERRPMAATYSKKQRELSPLALGTKDGERRLWAYQFGGESDYECKCFIVTKLSDVDVQHGEAPAPDSDPGPATCMDTILQRVSAAS